MDLATALRRNAETGGAPNKAKLERLGGGKFKFTVGRVLRYITSHYVIIKNAHVSTENESRSGETLLEVK